MESYNKNQISPQQYNAMNPQGYMQVPIQTHKAPVLGVQQPGGLMDVGLIPTGNNTGLSPFGNNTGLSPEENMPTGLSPFEDNTGLSPEENMQTGLSPMESNMQRGLYRQLSPILSNNPPVSNISLFKELTGYPNYGNPSRNADILYTGNRGSWTFNLPFPAAQAFFRAQILIRAVLDDHYNVPVNRYSARITVNGSVVHTGRVPLEHGAPLGGVFNNWRTLTFNIPNPRRNNRIDIVNTSNTGENDFIALDWMEMRLNVR